MPPTSEILENTLFIRAQIDAPDDLLWSYLSTPSGLACWQADAVEGNLQSGSFSLRWPDLGARLDLSVSELETGHRLVLRAGATSLSLSVKKGWVELEHRGLDAQDDLLGFESSWLTALALLDLAATRHPRAERRVTWLFERVPTTAAHLHCYFTEAAAIGTWLGSCAADFKTGKPFDVKLFGGERLSGKVLYCKRDVCLQVSEWNDGAFALRSLPGPEASRIAALGVSTWNAIAPTALSATLEGALRRLSTATQSRE